MPRPDKRSFLSLLTKDRLRDLGYQPGLEVKSEMWHEDLVELLASSNWASFQKLLGPLKRVRLNESRREHGLDDGGMVKEEIVAILRGGGHAGAGREEKRMSLVPLPRTHLYERRNGGGLLASGETRKRQYNDTLHQS